MLLDLETHVWVPLVVREALLSYFFLVHDSLDLAYF